MVGPQLEIIHYSLIRHLKQHSWSASSSREPTLNHHDVAHESWPLEQTISASGWRIIRAIVDYRPPTTDVRCARSILNYAQYYLTATSILFCQLTC